SSRTFESYSYLSSRIQICKVDQTMSKTRTVKCGIPQASMFADDTNVSTNVLTDPKIEL
ncbi:Hypothetical predicted protein, partial [Paramuricea clavata]